MLLYGHVMVEFKDVPSDGNCGFHALLLASPIFDGNTALITPMSNSVEDARNLFVRK